MVDKVNTRSMKRAWWIGALLVVFIALQFVRPGLTNPPVTAELNAPPEVKAILKNSCYNCHSNETKLPWFDQVAPAYWLLASDVKEARKHLDFSGIAAQAIGRYRCKTSLMVFPLLRTINTGARSAAPTVSTTEPCASSSAMMSP